MNYAKYIRYNISKMEIFSPENEHLEIATKLKCVKNTNTAGFIKIYTEDNKLVVECFGESESLGISSNPRIDSHIARKLLTGQ